MRVKEFIMMDAYSFHADAASLATTYGAMHDAYLRIFRRCGLAALAVEADSGAIGGSDSHEFMIGAEVGEDAILVDEAHGYAANIERAVSVLPAGAPLPGNDPAAEVPTPGAGSIAEVVAYLRTHGHPQVAAHHLAKTLLFIAETRMAVFTVAGVVRGDRELNEIKLTNCLSDILGEAGPVLALRPMTAPEVERATGAAVGFAGPVPGLAVDHLVIDAALDVDARWVTGANRTGHHLVGTRLTALPARRADLTWAVAGDTSLAGGTLVERRGIEAGHIFKLGTKYSAAMGCRFQDATGQLRPMIMGCYGIGTSRLVAAAVEQHHDAKGMNWPLAIAPYHCVVVIAKQKDPAIAAAGERLHAELTAAGVETVLDDRDLGAGVKFTDWELIGIPLRVVAGRGIASGEVEFEVRGGERRALPLATAAATVAAVVREGIHG
jgi:prolyl-tRNA synthetase